jgi:hypothetical protein
VGEEAAYIVYGGAAPVPPTATPTKTPTTPAQRAKKVYLPLLVRQSGVIPVPGDLVNGDFELGKPGWYEYSYQGWDLIMNSNDLIVPPHGGSWAVWLGGDDNEIAYVRQKVTVPTGRPYLTYWHWIASDDICGQYYDHGGVLVNSTVVDVYNLCASTATGGWKKHVVNLSAYKGKSGYIQIRAETDWLLNSNLFVDDVSFQSTSSAEVDEPAQYDPATVVLPKSDWLERTNPLGSSEAEPRLFGEMTAR